MLWANSASNAGEKGARGYGLDESRRDDSRVSGADRPQNGLDFGFRKANAIFEGVRGAVGLGREVCVGHPDALEMLLAMCLLDDIAHRCVVTMNAIRFTTSLSVDRSEPHPSGCAG
jgi:hypothetical protein